MLIKSRLAGAINCGAILRHLILDATLKNSFQFGKGIFTFYGQPEQIKFLSLLPAYLCFFLKLRLSRRRFRYVTGDFATFALPLSVAAGSKIRSSRCAVGPIFPRKFAHPAQ
jgi:hypothetical protein